MLNLMKNLPLLIFYLAFLPASIAQIKVGDSLMEIGDYRNAIAAYTNVEPNAVLQFKVAQSYTATGNYDKAIDAYKKGLESDNKFIKARFELAKLLLATNDIVQASIAFNKLVNEFPGNPTYLFYKGQCMEKLGVDAQAMDVYENVLKLDPDYRRARIELVPLLIKKRENQLAVKYCIEILQENPDDLKFNSLIAQAYFNAKIYSLAIKHLERLLELENDTEYNRRTLALSYFNNRDWKKAIESFDIFLHQYDQKDPAIYFLKSKAHLRLDEYEEALNAIEFAINYKRPAINQEYLQLSSVYAAQENLKEVFNTLTTAHKEYPEDRDIAFQLTRTADQYFKDKESILDYYERYLNKFGKADAYGEYASTRVSDLKKEIFMSGNN